MTLLIDGHNLIGKLPNISLSDPDDEARLVRVLENYHGMHPHEAILVVFDPSRDRRGGWSNMQTSSAGVTVRFAPRGTSADALIMKLLRDDKNARRITVISSDNAVRKAAREHGAKTLSAEEFIVKLREYSNPRRRKPAAPPPDPAANEKPSETDTEYWSQFFKEPPPTARKSKTPRAKTQSPPTKPAPARPSSPETEDIEYWLKVFGETSADDAAPPKDSSADSGTEYWLRVFNQKKP